MLGSYEFDRTRAPWWALGGVIAVVVGYVVYSFLGTVVFGLFLYYATRPVYRRLQRRIGSRSLAAGIALITLAVPFILLLVYTALVAIGELSEFVRGDGLGGLEAAVGPYVDVSEAVREPSELVTDPTNIEYVTPFLDDIGAYAGLVGTGALHVFVMLTLAYYLLKDDHLLARWVLETFGDEEGVLETYCTEIDRDFQSIFFGNVLNAFITGIIAAITFSVLNVAAPAEVVVPYPVLLGVLCGAASLIPVVGMKLVYVPVAAYLLVRAATTAPADLLWFPLVFLAVAGFVVDFIPDMILRPYVSGRDLHLGAVMLAYIVGPMLFGWYGIFLGPMLLIVAVHFVREVLPALVARRSVRPYAVDPAVARIRRVPVETDTGASEPAGESVDDEGKTEAPDGSD